MDRDPTYSYVRGAGWVPQSTARYVVIMAKDCPSNAIVAPFMSKEDAEQVADWANRGLPEANQPKPRVVPL